MKTKLTHYWMAVLCLCLLQSVFINSAYAQPTAFTPTLHAQEMEVADNVDGTPYYRLDAGVAFGGLDLTTDVANAPDTEFSMKTDPGVRLDLAGGYNVSEVFAVELEVGFTHNCIDDVEVEGVSLSSLGIEIDASYLQVPFLANVVLHLPLDSQFRPYLGAGLGGVWSQIDGDAFLEGSRVSSGSSDAFGFAFQVMAGFDYNVSGSIDLGLGYKLLGSLGQDFDGVKTDTILTHAVVLAITQRF